jgi:hypothetical protein
MPAMASKVVAEGVKQALVADVPGTVEGDQAKMDPALWAMAPVQWYPRCVIGVRQEGLAGGAQISRELSATYSEDGGGRIALTDDLQNGRPLSAPESAGCRSTA